MGNPLTIEEKQRLIRQATLASILIALAIISGKLIACWFTGSVSLLASLLDSILDIAASIINFLAARYAMQPPDNEHRFGHGKAEDLAAFAQASFIIISGGFVFFHAIRHLIAPEVTTHTTLGIGVMLFSTLLTILLVLFQRHVVAQTQSPVVKADSLHYVNDILINIVVIISLLSAQYWNISWIDGVFAIGIALYIMMGAWDIGVQSFHVLMDHEFKDEEREHIKALIINHPSVKGWHRLKTRSSGGKPFIQFDLELDGNITLREAHIISDEIEKKIMEQFPDAEILIHQDPV